MKVVVVDFETYWSTEHTLSKMSPLAYVMHEDTELISCSMKVDREPTKVAFGEKRIRAMLEEVDWADALLVGHNMSAFDAMICAWRLGLKPKMWGCTLAMARPIHAKDVGLGLAKLVAHYADRITAMGVSGKKDNTALVQTKGKKLRDFTKDELLAMKAYNRDDTEQCMALFRILSKHYSARELWQIDATIRMLVEPRFELDSGLLAQTLKEERERKGQALLDLADRLGVSRSLPLKDRMEAIREQMASAAKFSALLEKFEVSVPMKPSPTNPDKEVPALAKTDEEFLALLEHEDDLVAAAARLRLDVKSTMLETRIEAFAAAADAVRGKLPVPLHYCGADTTGRWSGWAYNPQNLPRIPRDKEGNIIDKPSNALRMSMLAPVGHKVVVADLSGIELRVNHFLWKVPSSMSLYQKSPDKADLYRDFASRLYDVEPAQVTKDQRQIGKVAHLGLGFGAGPTAFQRVAKTMGGVDMDLAEASEVTYKWREEYGPIVEGWKTCHRRLTNILMGDVTEIDPWGLTKTGPEGIYLPSGRIIRYPKLRKESLGGKTEWWYGEGRNKARIYAGKIDENIVQALARDVIADCAYAVFKQTGRRPQHTVHDELIYVVPSSEAHDLLDLVQTVMRTPPTWWPELVTWSEGDVADSYGEAK